MRARISSRSLLVVMAAIAALAIAVAFSRRVDSNPGDYITLTEGPNTVQLRGGDHTLYWVSPSHPTESAEFSDFEITVTSSSDDVHRSLKALGKSAYPFGDDSSELAWTIASITLTRPTSVAVDVRIIGSLPPGRLLLRR